MTNEFLIVTAAAGALLWLLFRGARLVVDGSPEGSGGGSFIPPGAPSTVTRWLDLAIEHGERHAINPRLILAVIWQESEGIPNAIGSVGEIGLMQLKDGAAIDVGYPRAPSDPWSNVDAGTAYLARQFDATGEALLALAAYNQGLKGSRQEPGRTKGLKYAREVLQKAGWL